MSYLIVDSKLRLHQVLNSEKKLKGRTLIEHVPRTFRSMQYELSNLFGSEWRWCSIGNPSSVFQSTIQSLANLFFKKRGFVGASVLLILHALFKSREIIYVP